MRIINKEERKRDYFGFGFESGRSYDLLNKENAINDYIRLMANRCQQIFKYGNLPDTIPQRVLELGVQTGYRGWYEYGNKLYVDYGGLGGEPDYNHEPTIFTVANPYLKYFDSLKIHEKCVIMRNDSTYMGLLPIHRKYATLLVENEITMRQVMINTRIPALISTNDDTGKESAEILMKNVEAGKLSILAGSPLLDGIKVWEYGKNGSGKGATDVIELEQYILARWFNELGLQANYNMKRESLNSNETQLNEDMLLPLIDDMLEQRRIALDEINSLFADLLDGNWITVEKNSAWIEKISGQLENEKEGEIYGYNVDSETETEEVGSDNATGEVSEVSEDTTGEVSEVSEDTTGEVSEDNSEVSEDNSEVSEDNSEVTVNIDIEINNEGGEEDEIETSVSELDD